MHPTSVRPKAAVKTMADRRKIELTIVIALAFVCAVLLCANLARAEEAGSGFAITLFKLSGNTLLPEEKLQEELRVFCGDNRSARDVENARRRLEEVYRQAGYPAVLVNIPPQEVQGGVVELEVIESRLGAVRVTGNRYHTEQDILERLPAFRRGAVLYLPEVNRQLAKLNRGSDLKVEPALMPGEALGTTDVELKVNDRFPLHGSLELSNRNAHDTSATRLNAVVHYDNLWQSGHSLAFQMQTAPQKPEEVKAAALSYMLPAPWNDEQMLAGYAVWSDSTNAFGEGFQTTGQGHIYGLQYVVPLAYYRSYSHNLICGLEYKRFSEQMGVKNSAETVKTPIRYMPLSVQYQSFLPDAGGATQFNAGLKTAVRGMVSRQEHFDDKRYKARSNFMVATLGLERDQKLARDVSLNLKLDLQSSDQPLIANEQYVAGGMQSVRGYHESEASADNAYHASLELRAPEIGAALKLPKPISLNPYVFYDAARLSIIKPLDSEDRVTNLEGAGLGLRGRLSRYLEFQIDLAWALHDTAQTQNGEAMLHCMVKAQF